MTTCAKPGCLSNAVLGMYCAAHGPRPRGIVRSKSAAKKAARRLPKKPNNRDL